MNNQQIPSCLVWSTFDIDLRLIAIEYIEELTKEQKQELLDIFFEQDKEFITEFINQRLENFLSEQL